MGTKTVNNGISACTLLTIVFVTLKLCDVIAWSRWWVLAPLWGPWAIVFTVTGIIGIMLVAAKVIVFALSKGGAK